MVAMDVINPTRIASTRIAPVRGTLVAYSIYTVPSMMPAINGVARKRIGTMVRTEDNTVSSTK